ncbi:leucine-rich repeat protein [Ruminococcus sp.]|uniref:leucine-rich repeat protein n=1 Tax=Ruminococcus sp. TaxID=41978 RepID=UPI003F0A2DB8
MKKQKSSTLLACLLVAAMLMTMLCIAPYTASAADEEAPVFTSGDYQYSLLDDGSAVIVKYTGTTSDLKIPAELDGKKVTSIGARVFQKSETLTAVTIPSGITTLGENAFNHCEKLTKLTLSEGLTVIGHGSFSYCTALEEVSIPDSVTTIGNFAFQNCEKMTSLKLSNNISDISDFSFSGCKSLPPVTLPASVRRIGQNAFAYCNGFTNVVIPSGVTLIDGSAFSYCGNLVSISLPDTLETINGFAFCNCTSLKEITVPDSVTTVEHMALGYWWDSATWNYFKTDGFVLKGYTGSATDRYAQEYGINFESIGISDQPQPTTIAPTTGEPTSAPDPTEPGASTTVYFKNNAGHTDVYAYYWPKGGNGPIGWPGVAMTKVKDDIYVIEVPAGNNMIIFSNKGSNKTLDLDIPGNNYIYDGSGWSVYADAPTEPVTTEPTEPATTEPVTTVPDTTAPSTEPTTTTPATEPTTAVVTTQPEPEYTLGDVNNDGEITITDATLVLRANAGFVTLTTTQIKSADVNFDGIVNVKDATLIQKYIAELIKQF